MIKIPNNSKWYQSNRGDIFGSIWSSMGIDLTHQRDNGRGNVRLNRMLLGATSATLTDMGTPVAFRTLNNITFALAGADLYKQGAAHTSSWSKVSSSPGNFSIHSDMEIFNSKLYISEGTDDDLQSYDGSTWTELAGFATGASKPHMMCVYANQLYISGATGGNSVIKGINTSESLVVTLTIVDEPKNIITFLRPTTNGIWIGTVNSRGGKGTVWFWDGVQTSPNVAYHLESAGALAGVIKDNTLYIVDVDGRLLYFNGSTFLEVDRLPIKENYLTFSLGDSNTRWIHPNGMTVADNRILFLIENQYYIGALKDTIEENVPSGIWEWSEDTGLYHKYGLCNTPLSGAGGGTVVDYGQNRIGTAGACAFIKQNRNPSDDNGTLFAGARIYTNATSLIYGIFIDDLNDTVQKYGYFITPKIYSQNVEDVWQKVYIRHKKLLESTDKIVVKYRVDEEPPAEATITWVDTNTFTSTDADFANYIAGDEIEVIQGDGSGKCAHISSISENAGTYTVNLDDTFSGVTTNTAKVRMQKWIKSAEQTSQTVRYMPFPIMRQGTWVQIKVCMQFTGQNELDDMILLNETSQPAK